MKFKKLFNFKLWTILTSVFAVLMVIFIVGTHIAVTFGSAAINMIFGTSTTKVIGTTESMRFDSDWADTNGTGLFIEDKIMTRKAAAEGAVLLWNKDVGNKKALPIEKDSAVSLFSHSSVDFIESGTGSGHIDTVTQGGKSAKTTLKTALERYYSVNNDLWRFYDIGAGSKYTRDTGWGSTTKKWYVHEVPWSAYTSTITGTFADYGDAAIIIISRTGGENGDLHFSQETTTEAGGYLSLTQEEKDMLQAVGTYRANGTFKRTVLVFNTGNPMQLQDFEPYTENIDAALWVGQGGTAGVNALAELLVGNESPSGRLSDTLAYNLFSQPSTENDDLFTYSNTASKYAGSNLYNHYMVYDEGIYVGYKYYETRYTDSVLDAAGTNALSAKGAKHSESGWSYDGEVAFPFGYGGSYSEFEYSSFDAKYDEENKQYVVSLDVKNVGSAAAKEVIQVYLSKPYTDRDKSNNIEVAAVELVGFAKTDKLAANGRGTVKINVPAEYFKTYDASYDNGDGTFGRYVVEAGNYYLTAATDSHVAANNVIAARGGSPLQQKVMVGSPRRAQMGASFVKAFTLAEDAATYAVSSQTGEKVYNKLDCADINKYENRGDNSVTYLSRKDWDGTYPAPVQLTMTDKMADDLAITFVSPKAATADKPMPTYGKFASGSTNGLPDVENGDLVVFDFIDAPLNKYDENWSEEWEAKWNQLLDQMTWYEQANICANAYHQLVGATSIALPGSRQENGPVGITKRSESNWQIPNDSVKDWNYVAYPNAPVLASTFNVDIVEQVGQHMSEDMLYLGYNGIYGPGGNIHRSPFGGRNWEYYSEDAVLAGLIGAAQCKGIENKGCLAYVKHFAFNEMETYRHHCGIWSNEQASREIYLRAFELIFTEGKASATMNSFTRVGTTWTGMSKELQTDILRIEWGWDGINITDWIESDCMSKPDAIIAGTNSFDGNGKPETYFAGWDKDPDFAWKLRESAKIIIYNVARTHTLNGLTRDSIVVEVTPWWQASLYALIGVFTFLTVAAATMLTLSVIFKRKAAAAQSASDGGETESVSDGEKDESNS